MAYHWDILKIYWDIVKKCEKMGHHWGIIGIDRECFVGDISYIPIGDISYIQPSQVVIRLSLGYELQ